MTCYDYGLVPKESEKNLRADPEGSARKFSSDNVIIVALNLQNKKRNLLFLDLLRMKPHPYQAGPVDRFIIPRRLNPVLAYLQFS